MTKENSLMYNTYVQEGADRIAKEMERYIKMQTIMPVQVYEELDIRGYKMDLLGGGNDKVMVVIYRK